MKKGRPSNVPTASDPGPWTPAEFAAATGLTEIHVKRMCRSSQFAKLQDGFESFREGGKWVIERT